MQPDGTSIDCFASGDQYYHWLHDGQGFTIVQSTEDGFFYYAIENDGKLVPSVFKVGFTDPAGKGLKSWSKISENEYRERIKLFKKTDDSAGEKQISLKSVTLQRFHEGTLNNLVVFIKFKDDPDFSQNKARYDSIFNNSIISVNSYYREVSYNKLDIRSMLYPQNTDLSKTVPYIDYHDRSFYQPYNKVTNTNGYVDFSQQQQRLEGLLKNALEFVASQVSDTLILDKNNDGKIDNLCYVVRGKADGWNDLTWPHRSTLSGSIVKINGAKAYDYTFQVENTDVKTFCHEMFHLLGAPDLYHYSYDGLLPAGDWDLMESGFVHMGAYMKLRYADSTWIGSIPEITQSGRYSLKPLLSAVNNAYMFRNKEIDSTSFFVVEYRKKQEGTFEANLPGSGLLVYRINPKIDGNSDGPPDGVYIYRPNGTEKVNGDLSKAALSNVKGWALGTKSAPLFYTDDQSSGIKISDISEAGDSISFTVLLEKSNEANINSFFILGMTNTAVINKSAGTIYCNVSSGTSLKNAKPIISLSELATISPASGSVIDLSKPYSFTVTAENGSTRIWTVYANSDISNETNILSLELLNVEGEIVTINNETKTVNVVVPDNTDLTGLSVKIVASEAASITPEPFFVTDFRSPVTFEVKAENGTTVQWMVQITHINGTNFQQINDNLFELQKIGNEIALINRTEKNAQVALYNLNGRLIYTINIHEGSNILSLEPHQPCIIIVSNKQYRKVYKMVNL
jgi:M6 family metalloprotease-like protein